MGQATLTRILLCFSFSIIISELEKAQLKWNFYQDEINNFELIVQDSPEGSFEMVVFTDMYFIGYVKSPEEAMALVVEYIRGLSAT